MVQEPAPVMCTVPGDGLVTVHCPLALKLTGKPEDADALTGKSGSPKLLFANGKGEVLTTVTTGKGKVLVIFNGHHRFLFPLGCIRSAKQHVYIYIEWDGTCRRHLFVKAFYRRDISRSDP